MDIRLAIFFADIFQACNYNQPDELWVNIKYFPSRKMLLKG